MQAQTTARERSNAKRLCSIAETAEMMGVSKDTIRRLINRKALLAVRISRRILIPLSEIERACTQGIQ